MKTKRKTILLLLMCLVNVHAGNDDCSSNKKDKLLFNALLHIMDEVTVKIGGENQYTPFTPSVWLALDSVDEGCKSVEETIKCYLIDLKNEELLNKYRAFQDAITLARYNAADLKTIRRQLDDPDFLGQLSVDDGDLKADLWPVVSMFGVMHINLYQRLIELEGDKYNDRHDEVVEFYTKLILRYWKNYRETLIINRSRGIFRFLEKSV